MYNRTLLTQNDSSYIKLIIVEWTKNDNGYTSLNLINLITLNLDFFLGDDNLTDFLLHAKKFNYIIKDMLLLRTLLTLLTSI